MKNIIILISLFNFVYSAGYQMQRNEGLMYLGKFLWGFLMYFLDEKKQVEGLMCVTWFIFGTILTKIVFFSILRRTSERMNSISKIAMFMVFFINILIYYYTRSLDIYPRVIMIVINSIMGVFAAYNPLWGMGIKIWRFIIPYSTMISFAIMMIAKFFGDNSPREDL